VKNKRYIRLSKKMKARCDGKCNGGEKNQCKYYWYCFHKYILFPKFDSLTYIQKKLKGMKIEQR